MSGVQRFEDLVAWQKVRGLARDVYGISRQGAFGRDFGLAGQIQRAAVSVMSNIAEGFERGRPTEFHQFLSTAKASCAEVRSHLYIALDAGHPSRTELDSLLARAEETARVIGGLRAATERAKNGQRGGP